MLFTLRSMGHGDEIAIVDGNYPALTDAKRLIRSDGHNVTDLLEAILSILPIDYAVDDAIFRAVNTEFPDVPEPVHIEIEKICRNALPDRQVVPLAPSVFYERVKCCHAIVASSDMRFFGNIILRKGVIGHK